MNANSHYFTSNGDLPSQRTSIEMHLPDCSFSLTTDNGVFSKDGIDPGTKYLLTTAPSPPQFGHIADLGCGYGPIALTIARRAPATTVWAIDVNPRAVELTALNAASYDLDHVQARLDDDVPVEIQFAAIYSNPPIRIGKQALHDMLDTWLPRLVDDGVAYLVVNKNLGADSLMAWLIREGWRCQRLASSMGYRILQVQHNEI